MSRPVKRAKTFERTTLKGHTDHTEADEDLIKEVTGGFIGGVQSAVHYVATVFVAAWNSPKFPGTGYTQREGADLREVWVPAGSVVLWRSDVVHTNKKEGDWNYDDYPVDVQCNPHEVLHYLIKYGVAVVPYIMGSAYARDKARQLMDVVASHSPTGVPTAPPGSGGCMIVNTCGIPYHPLIQELRLDPTVKVLFSLIYGTSDLVLSADSITYRPAKIPGDDPRRAGIFISWGPAAAQEPGVAEAKLKRAEAGGTMRHTPFRCEKNGGPGHMSNSKDPAKRWKIVLYPISTETKYAFGFADTL